MTELAKKKYVLKKVTAVIAAIAFFVLMLIDLTAALDTGDLSTEALLCTSRGLLYGAGAVMLVMTGFCPKNSKRYYAACLIMVLIIAFDVAIERRFTLAYIIPALGFNVVQLSEERWERVYVKIMALLLIVISGVSIWGGAWHVKNNIEYWSKEHAYKGPYSKIKMATQNDGKGYIEVGGSGAARWSPAFKYEKFKMVICQTPFDYKEIKKDGKVKEEKVVQWDNLNLVTDDHKEAKLTQDIKEILKASLIFDEEVINIRIYKVKDEYYVEPARGLLNWTPHEYYEFDKEKKKLRKIISLKDETVIGIKRVK